MVILGLCHAAKLSPRCRQIANFAHNLRIPIVPVLLEALYQPDGWLGFIVSTTIYSDFTGDTFSPALLSQLETQIEHAFYGEVTDGIATPIFTGASLCVIVICLAA